MRESAEAAELADALWAAAHYFRRGGWVMPGLALVSVWLWTLIVFKLREVFGQRKCWLNIEKHGIRSGYPAQLAARFEANRCRGRSRDQAWLESLVIREKESLDRHVSASCCWPP